MNGAHKSVFFDARKAKAISGKVYKAGFSAALIIVYFQRLNLPVSALKALKNRQDGVYLQQAFNMDTFLYNIFIRLYPVIAFLIAPFNNKAKLWLKGRINLLSTIEKKVAGDSAPKIWIHAASLGEFEQGRTVLENIRKQYPNYKIVLTFFSPSGYEAKKNYPLADYVFYMPMDSQHNASRFYDLINPKLILFIKYDYWYYYLQEAAKRNIPLFLVSGIFLQRFSFFKWYGGISRKMLRFFTMLFLQDSSSGVLLETIGITNYMVVGDSRFDRVLEVAQNMKPIPEIERFCEDKNIVVAGSTWSEDDEALDHYTHIHPELRFIVAPHDITRDRIEESLRLYKNAVLFSDYCKFTDNQLLLEKNINTLIIDNIGMLKRLYYYGSICYVGGGFGGDGIHNMLEAAVFNKPVIIGPEHEKSAESFLLIENGAAFEIEDALELEEKIDLLLTDKKLYKEACEASGKYVQSNAGATKQVMQYIQENLLLTN